MARRRAAAAPRVYVRPPIRRTSKYIYKDREVKHKPSKRLAIVVAPQNVGIDEMWFIRFVDNQEPRELVVYESDIVPYRQPACRCGQVLNNTHKDCPECRWFVCPTCGRCGCWGKVHQR